MNNDRTTTWRFSFLFNIFLYTNSTHSSRFVHSFGLSMHRRHIFCCFSALSRRILLSISCAASTYEVCLSFRFSINNAYHSYRRNEVAKKTPAAAESDNNIPIHGSPSSFFCCCCYSDSLVCLMPMLTRSWQTRKEKKKMVSWNEKTWCFGERSHLWRWQQNNTRNEFKNHIFLFSAAPKSLFHRF